MRPLRGGWKIGYRDSPCRQLSDQSFGYTRLFWCRARIPRLIRATIDNAGRDLCSETFLIAFSRAGVGRGEEGYIYRERKPGRERNRTIMMRFIGSIVPSSPNSSSQVQLMCIYRPPLSSVAISISGWCRLARDWTKGEGPSSSCFHRALGALYLSISDRFRFASPFISIQLLPPRGQ